MKDKMLLSISEVSESLGVSRPTVYRLMRNEGLPIIHLGGRILIPVRQLEEWIDERTKSTKGGNAQ